MGNNPLHSSDSNEWYTPPIIIDAVEDTLGRIDLDPASCETAQKTVNARKWYSKADDGLSRRWEAANLFLNPPYGKGIDPKTGKQRSNAAIWIEKLIGHYLIGDVEQAILLINGVPDRNWFQPLWKFPICFPSSRIKFVDQDGIQQKSPTHGNAIVYLPDSGSGVAHFRDIWQSFGHVVPVNETGYSLQNRLFLF